MPKRRPFVGGLGAGSKPGGGPKQSSAAFASPVAETAAIKATRRIAAAFRFISGIRLKLAPSLRRMRAGAWFLTAFIAAVLSACGEERDDKTLPAPVGRVLWKADAEQPAAAEWASSRADPG